MVPINVSEFSGLVVILYSFYPFNKVNLSIRPAIFYTLKIKGYVWLPGVMAPV